MTNQIGLPFDWQAQARTGSFLVSEANRLAQRHVERWSDWPIPISVLSGPARSGRSTLGRHFVALSGGLLIDDADRAEERQLFHQWNIARDSGRPLLLIGREAPALWPVELPDLKSRLAAAPHVRIGDPDDALIRQLIETGLAQAGSAYVADVPEWLARRVERSYAAVAEMLVRLNRLSLEASRRISVPFLKEALQMQHFSPIVGDDDTPPPAANDAQEEER
ncbi:regulatory inactivation of DnaA Hda protein [Sphingobium jiangsuense]|uniref:Chromosomal replication initiation ATPase DnaA n=1 Tax=Sphingobium jiangsuense TaxID=870476 RepID=A0A7W6FR01_9SPHN|nr:chromosomal replication initiator DnaA [Sphingobium jiangsuense]MBB3927480.1 chromosomal replication initiation ATPase DnaA [Sphingobium jiangsuense]GLT00067.1 regulatory inactivation of DnaA Hda protein [Sphingobium jiangsuense]